jgi:TRAP-type mannitol/chloroaromatic compound transport system permease large subunit
MVTGVIQAGSSLGILVPPSVVLVLYGMIARQPVGQLWLAGVFPGLLMAGLFVAYIAIRCFIQRDLGPALPAEERQVSWGEKLGLLRAGIIPLCIFFSMTGLFLMGVTNLTESSAVGATAATLAALVKGRLTRQVMEETVRKTLGVSCMFMWIILAALCFGAVFDGLGAVKAIESFFLQKVGLGPWEILIMMQLSYLLMGMFLDDISPEGGPGPLGNPHHDAALLPSDGNVPGRYGHARHRRAALCPPGQVARVRPGLVRRSLYDHLPDRLHDATFRL